MGELVMHREILDLAELALGNWCERIQLKLAPAIELHPGALAQFPHRDQDMWQGALGDVEYLMNVMWPLTPVTEDNGATIIWPRSHGVEALIEQPKEAPVVAEAEPGDAIIFLGSTLHGAAGNGTLMLGGGIIISFCFACPNHIKISWFPYLPALRKISRPIPPPLPDMPRPHPNPGILRGQAPSVLFGG